jgi:hypothetical protein
MTTRAVFLLATVAPHSVQLVNAVSMVLKGVTVHWLPAQPTAAKGNSKPGDAVSVSRTARHLECRVRRNGNGIPERFQFAGVPGLVKLFASAQKQKPLPAFTGRGWAQKR